METSLPQEVLLWKSQRWKHWDFPAVIFLLDQSEQMLLYFSAVVMWQNSVFATAPPRAHRGAGTALGSLAGREGGIGEWGAQEGSCGICRKAVPGYREGLQGSSTRNAGTGMQGCCRQKPLPRGVEKSKNGRATQWKWHQGKIPG